jgi:hypothetical protein
MTDLIPESDQVGAEFVALHPVSVGDLLSAGVAAHRGVAVHVHGYRPCRCGRDVAGVIVALTARNAPTERSRHGPYSLLSDFAAAIA